MPFTRTFYVVMAFELLCDYSFIFMTLTHYVINFDFVYRFLAKKFKSKMADIRDQKLANMA